jgi:hypothetical protein
MSKTATDKYFLFKVLIKGHDLENIGSHGSNEENIVHDSKASKYKFTYNLADSFVVTLIVGVNCTGLLNES